MENSASHLGPRLGVFHLSCWILALVAFVQVMSVGVALALRPEATVVERVVTEYIQVSRPSPVIAAPPKGVKLEASEPEMDFSTISNQAIGIDPSNIIPVKVFQSAPLIADPVAERLVNEARDARIKSDHMGAIIKLDEALSREPDNPAIIYEMGTNFEVMGIYDKAITQYLKVNSLGPIKGGSLWKKASLKLEKGIVPEIKGLTSLGVVRLSTPEDTPQGERRAVVLPVIVAPNQDFDPNLLETKVHFFEKQKGEVKQVTHPENQGYSWLSDPVDWLDGEELVEVWYHIPPSDMQQRHLFGEREFYGYVAELYFAGELVDLRAQPRTLISKMRGRNSPGDSYDSWDPEIDPILESLQDYEAGDPLLPKLPQRRGR